jgi:hypothetical protein
MIDIAILCGIALVVSLVIGVRYYLKRPKDLSYIRTVVNFRNSKNSVTFNGPIDVYMTSSFVRLKSKRPRNTKYYNIDSVFSIEQRRQEPVKPVHKVGY